MKRFLNTLTVCTFSLAALGALGGCGSSGSDGAARPTTTAASPASPASAASGGTGDGAGSYTMAQVQQHNSEQSCWTTINDKVYDVTQWIDAHPGGTARIKNLCGTDGTQAFTGQHEGADGPQERLASFQIGTLSK